MKSSSFKRVKLLSLIVFVLAVLFFAFFDITKHVPVLAQVNPFAIDPYDAVGSFGIQFVFFVALLTMLRAFRPYGCIENIADQEMLIVRSDLMAVLSVVLVLAGDSVGMLHHPSVWISSPGGWMLASTLAGIMGLTALTGWMVFHGSASQLGHGSWKLATIICLASLLILVVYPPAWDEGIFGGIFTAALGMLLFFISVWSISKAISPESNLQHEDLMDDLTAIYHWIKDQAGFLRGVFQIIEKFMLVPQVRPLVEWLDPRKHVWNLIILIAIAGGIALALVEAIAEGTSPDRGRAIIVTSVFIGLEAAGILLGYGLLARFLGIYRPTNSV